MESHVIEKPETHNARQSSQHSIHADGKTAESRYARNARDIHSRRSFLHKTGSVSVRLLQFIKKEIGRLLFLGIFCIFGPAVISQFVESRILSAILITIGCVFVAVLILALGIGLLDSLLRSRQDRLKSDLEQNIDRLRRDHNEEIKKMRSALEDYQKHRAEQLVQFAETLEKHNAALSDLQRTLENR